MLLTQVLAVSRTVAATRSRREKVRALSELLAVADTHDVETVVAWLSGELSSGRIGVGWRTIEDTRTAAAATPTLTVAGVARILDEIAAESGPGSVARRRELLTELFAAATESEQRFIVQLISGDLRQGALEGVMTEAIAAAAHVPHDVVRRAFMVVGRLPVTAAVALRSGAPGLEALRMEVGTPVRPMLASPAKSLDDAMRELGPDVTVEYKFDGARIQVHRAGSEVRIFTRSLREITGSVPELVSAVRELRCSSVVLDGETLALRDDGRPRPFQETMSRFGADAGELLLQPFFFDCLHVDGQDLLDSSLEERLDALERVAPDNRIPAVIRPGETGAHALLADALDSGHEGVMVKSLTSPYAAGRRGSAWRKVKPVHTLDLIVLGAEWGYGRRTGYLSNLHLGARDPHGGPPIMLGKTFKGLTDALLEWQTTEFPRHERTRDEHTVYLHPALVVEIAVDGVQVSSRYPGEVTLRFARVVRYRPDKSVEEADTIDAVRAMLVR
ncbi:ATP-dependent DNA ligase [Hoyosella subflava]|uniref:DNA ligase n=1 Tax=Hoyosella subflava (strain DSM 45089 / JCM 17490 / NBRC 109087 / DQS3-9A1) TaxID=443218 RepID=F6EI88_HOYSD|nr:ATP-dependent DNA ligase [Hoyosella subflava]AEF41195.1 putative DNA ligase [Hoyosella subflava DQS3-9A1]